jgi:hypothetical protein
MRSASATNRLITRSNSRLCSGPVAVFNSEAIASSLRCTWAKSWLGMYWIMPVTAERLNIIAGSNVQKVTPTIIFLIAVSVFEELRLSRTHFEPHVHPPTISAPRIAWSVVASLLKSETVDRTYSNDAVVSVS